ncbi:flavodoxin [uncultured Treponema sp.]|uniref:flavodoxin n=1 Tax=uncultured Treponema sp. TaxID=162155 RepID=UPI0025DBE3E1|nr:flavodoxin [uncultured Treponema sp.]
MKKAVIYASTTGNTEAMANAVAEGVKSCGAELLMSTASEASVSDVLACDVIILGSPAMGDEVLEDSMEEFYTNLEGGLSGKKVAVFGSYDWGDGQWLRTWVERLSAAGATVVNGEGLKAQLAPDEAALAECKSLGETA